MARLDIRFAITVAMLGAASTLGATTARAADRVRRPAASVHSAALDRFLAQHKGPVLHVSFATDCPQSLLRTTHHVPFDHDFPDADVQRAADDLFVAEVRRSRVFVQANRNQTPVLVVCCGGVRSARAAEVLARYGFNAMALADGVAGNAVSRALLAQP